MFKNKFKLSPNLPAAEPFCVRKQISFFANISKRRRIILKITRRKLEQDREYDEWLIKCNVLDVAENKPKIYYVSRGDLQHRVFLYTRPFSDERVFVDSYMKNIAVADVGNNSRGVANTLPLHREDETLMGEYSSTETEDNESEHQSLYEGHVGPSIF